MVSRQEGTLFSRKRDFTAYGEEFHNLFKKTKQEDQSHQKIQRTTLSEGSNSESMRSVTFDFELNLHTPLPSGWQKSTDAKSYSRTSEDFSTCAKEPVLVERPKMSLDLELNLSPSYSPTNTATKIEESSNHNENVSSSKGNSWTSPSKKTTTGTGSNRSLSWLAFEGGDDDVDHKEQEMVTKVCMKCHMLVMLSTSTPVCPNCKFMHPHDHSSTKLFKPSNLLRLLC
ncbi:E3 ubiquitin-protein ligase [Hirschfeldia incana]|nr:E3 ubiquitin-protein ligase [Hirschfeldia incana]